jgi:hypothetical protein
MLVFNKTIMKKTIVNSLFSLLVQFMVAIPVSHGQMVITSGTNVSANDLVQKIVGVGIHIYNVEYFGADSAKAVFYNGDATNLGINSGIILSTGKANSIQGPNMSYSAGSYNGMPGHFLFGGDSHDAAILQFSLIPEADTLFFKYVFGSEEYNESVGGSYNDMMGIFITGNDPTGGTYYYQNIAVVPESVSIPISINTVNNGHASGGVIPTGPCTNCEYYLDNTNGLTIEYDGFTTVLTAWVLVVPCESYQLIIGISDKLDAIKDSGLAIEENILSASLIGYDVVLDTSIINNDKMIEGFVGAEVIMHLPNAGYAPTTIFFDIQGTAVNGVDYEWIDNWIVFEEGHETASVSIVPLGDGIIEGDETVILIIENSLGCLTRYDTITLIISDYIEMTTVNILEPFICQGQEVDIWINVSNGYTPYSYLWEPGSFTTDTISVSPEETTNYTVTCTDLFMETFTDSVLVTVLPGHLNEMIEFSFESATNPLLAEDVPGVISGDSVLLMLPSAQGIGNLIATFTASSCAEAYVDDEVQISGFTANDFTFPVTYEVMASNGDIKEWVVKVDFLSGQKEWEIEKITIYPNPAKDRLQITGAAGYEVSLFNAFGVKLLQETITEKNTFLDVRNIEPGIYYLKFSYDDQRFVRKVVVTK